MPAVASPSATASRRPRADRQRALVQVAYRLIAERGLEGLRFGDVARQAGINNGTLLYYFPSKEALVQAVVAYLIEEFSVSQAPRPPAAHLDALAELRGEFEDARLRLRQQVGIVYTELLVRSQRDPAVLASLRHMDDAWRGWLATILDRGRAQGVFRSDLDTALVTTTIMAVIKGVGLQAVTAGDPNTVDSAMSAVAGLIERWLTPPPA